MLDTYWSNVSVVVLILMWHILCISVYVAKGTSHIYQYVIVFLCFLMSCFLFVFYNPPLRLQASHCSTFCIMCDVPSIAVFCSESIECFNFFSASFCTTFLSAGIATSISVHVFSFLFLIIISGLFAATSLSVHTAYYYYYYYYYCYYYCRMLLMLRWFPDHLMRFLLRLLDCP